MRQFRFRTHDFSIVNSLRQFKYGGAGGFSYKSIWTLLELFPLINSLKAKCWTDWVDWMDWLSYTAVTPRASLQSDANKCLIYIVILCSA